MGAIDFYHCSYSSNTGRWQEWHVNFGHRIRPEMLVLLEEWCEGEECRIVADIGFVAFPEKEVALMCYLRFK